ncbi:MAG: gluconate 2-dehydrogenase subunit 3 family protein [Syntrophobacteraceae bacterium]
MLFAIPQSIFQYLRKFLALRHARKVAKLNSERSKNGVSWFTPDESALLTALASLIVPSDETSPGAQDTEVVNTLESIVGNSSWRKPAYSLGMYSIDQWAILKYGVTFIDLAERDQLSVMKLIDLEYQNLTKNTTLFKKLSRKFRVLVYARKGLFDAGDFFQLLVSDVLHVFYTCEVSWIWLGYDGPPMPLGYPDLSERRITSDDSPMIPTCSPAQDGERRILVCLKQVPGKESFYTIGDSGRVKDETGYYETNQTDLYALEQALILKRNKGAQVTVLSVGNKRVLNILRDALAKGADRAIHVDFTCLDNADPFLSARIIANAINDEKYDLVLTGVESTDLAWGQTGVILAYILKVAYGTIVTNVDVDKNWVTAAVERELENNTVERAEITLPAVLTIHTSSIELGRATLKGILQARKKEIRTVSPKGPGSVPSCPGLKVADSKFYFPEKRKNTVILEGSVKEVTHALIDKLRQDAKIL